MDDDEDDEEPKGPTKYEFSVESKLDEDHLFYLQFTNNFISNVSRPRDFDHCTRWLERLAGEPMYGVEAKRNRNMFLAMLLCAMQDNKVKGPFSTFPPSGPLPNAAIAFGLTNPEDEGQGDMMFDEIDRELNMSDYNHTSEDGRTYIATCALPNSSGVMAYVGLTFGGGEGLWLNKDGYQVPLATGDRIPAVTPVTPVRKYMDMIAEHKQKVREGLDQEPEEPSEDAFKFLIDMPMSSSDADLLELGSYKLNPKNAEFLLDLYPQELVDALQDFLVASKKDIEKRLQARHEKLVKDMYREYSQEIERGLREYKEARQEWALVYQVVAELKEVVKEREAKDNEAASQGKSETASGRPTGLLIQSLNDSKSRQKAQYKIGQELDSKKTEIHKEIHERAMFHVHEIERFEAHVARLTADICKLRQDNKKKQQVIQTLNLQLENMKSDM